MGNAPAIRASVAGDEGDHIIEVATSAGTMAAGLIAEFERESALLLLSLEFRLGDDRPELDEPGIDDLRLNEESSFEFRINIRIARFGTPILPNRRLLRRLLMNQSSSRTSSIARFHTSAIFSSSIIAGLRFRTRNLRGIKILMNSSG